MEIAYESSKWKKEDVEKYTIYKKKLKFGEFKFVKDGKANYSDSSNCQTNTKRSKNALIVN